LNHHIYVVGGVGKPGEFGTPHRVSVVQALSMASGLPPFTDDGDVRIIRRIREKDRRNSGLP
jgi:polysaccharide export outer membrane protein